jgi:hypothetical protein
VRVGGNDGELRQWHYMRVSVSVNEYNGNPNGSWQGELEVVAMDPVEEVCASLLAAALALGSQPHKEGVLYSQRTGPIPLNHRDDFD